MYELKNCQYKILLQKMSEHFNSMTYELQIFELECLLQDLLHNPKGKIHDVKLTAHDRCDQEQESISRKRRSITINTAITELHRGIVIGPMTQLCLQCRSLKF